MDLWIPITVFAAFCQNLRSALQKHLKGRLGTSGATFVRFAYGVPFAWLYVWGLNAGLGLPFPELPLVFYPLAFLGGLAQIAATFLLIHLFSYRNFTAGTAYSKTEPIQAALFGWLLIGETVTLSAGIGILLGVIGVVTVSLAREPKDLASMASALSSRPAFIGLASAGLFGASAALYRSAALSLEGTGYLMQAGFALALVTLFQTFVMGAWMAVRRPAELSATIRTWRSSVFVGITGIAGSIGWFTAMTLQQVAYVRALAQIELVFTLLFSVFVFREKLRQAEIIGCLLIGAAVVVVVLAS
ncbi:membrane protein [Roseibium aquae]|uniref:Membrane protein n=1 Tax=Roseibium aquae TaxID=1323746 RepID=A0A916TM21_9HYPH|nr:EamA family transporter [Roseibium aquae]GGB57174.1 membrane protein [Roseibium aquae]